MIGTIQDYYAHTLVPLALKGLRPMLLPEGVFCDSLRRSRDGELRPSGQSLRYSTMTLIGLAMQERLGQTWDMPLDDLWQRLFAWATTETQLGDAGLVLWAMAVKGDMRAERLAQSILTRESETLDARCNMGSMSLGWLLTGLSAAMQNGVGGQRLATFAEKVYRRLLQERNDETSLFALGGSAFRRNPFQRRLNGRLGSFASQVYPTIGLSYYAMASKSPEPLEAAAQTAEAICRLQGPAGQWWWIYDVRSGTPVMRYPVYSVHQHAMGPMALLSVSRASKDKIDFSQAIRKSLDWLENHPELPDMTLFASASHVIWRAIQRDEPSRTADFGLGRAERLRMHLAAWTGLADKRSFSDGFLCDECRPYELGWILVAGAMACELGTAS